MKTLKKLGETMKIIYLTTTHKLESKLYMLKLFYN